MGTLRRVARLRTGLAVLVLLALLAGCSRQAPAPPSAPPAPAAPVAEAPVPAASAPLADAERDAVLFTHWRATHAEVEAFEEYLVRERVAEVVPSYQLLRS